MPITPIDGHTQLVGLIGWPVEHSVSPAMHNAAFAELRLNWRYVPLPVPPGQVQIAIHGLGALGFRGANVTVPHKEPARLALNRLFGSEAVARDAKALGAVNTLVVERGENAGDRITFSGHNTDVAGFLGALRDGGFRPQGTAAVVVGAGGAARAVVFGLMAAKARDIAVLNRTLERAETLVSDLDAAPGGAARPAIQALSLTHETLIEAARTAQLLVNATPVGMWPHVDRSIWPEEVPVPSHLTIFDLVYNPLETKLQRQARTSGAHGIDGLGMLVRQGALAFEMWTGEEAPVPVMRRACERSLRSAPRP
jgi:shikimate dehydrogenase